MHVRIIYFQKVDFQDEEMVEEIYESVTNFDSKQEAAAWADELIAERPTPENVTRYEVELVGE